MVYKIRSTTKKIYEENLSGFITKKIILENKEIVFIDCMNYINQYMFNRKYIQRIMDNLYISRIELIYDLLDILKSIQFNSYFQKSNVLLISSFKHLLDDLSKEDVDYFNNKITLILDRLEKYKKEIVVMELYKKWVTQYRLNA